MAKLSVYIDLGGGTPPLEATSAVGSCQGLRRARLEASAYIGQLRRVLGKEPREARLAIAVVDADGGSELTVVCRFHPWNAIAEAYAQRCADEGPLRWDEIALKRLKRPKLRRRAKAIARLRNQRICGSLQDRAVPSN